MKLSIILPLFDLRNAFETQLTSLLNQSLERTRYEIVVVIPEQDKYSFPGKEPYKSLLSRCDQIIFVDADPEAPESEILFYSAGCEKAIGDLLFFVEGHTAILPDACSSICDHFDTKPQCLAAWGFRLNHNSETLGKLIGMHNIRHENVAKQNGWFTFGANSIIRTSEFRELGGFEAKYGRFNESIMFERLRKRGTNVDRLDYPVSIHYNDMSVAHLMQLAEAMGRWRTSYFLLNTEMDATDNCFATHRMARLVGGRGSARLWLPVFSALSFALLQMAKVIFSINRRLAYRVFVSGLGFCDLSGYTHVRLHGLKN